MFVFVPGRDNRTTLEQVEKGYRMPKPAGINIDCPQEYYEIMLDCWHKIPDKRPTFEYLKNTFEDYFVSTEKSYAEDY